MCLSKAYLDKSGRRELLAEDVASVEVRDGKLLLKTLFGEQQEVTASIKQIDFVTHSISLEYAGEGQVPLREK